MRVLINHDMMISVIEKITATHSETLIGVYHSCPEECISFGRQTFGNSSLAVSSLVIDGSLCSELTHT